MTVRHILKADDLSPTELERVFIRAKTFGKDFYPGAKRVLVALVFFEPSTRTTMSFDAAVKRMCGDTIVTSEAKFFSSIAKGESLSDMIRVMAGYADCIVLRHDVGGAITEAVEKLGRRLTVPVINAGDGANEHPTQAQLDLFTIWEAMQDGRLPKKKLNIVFFGDNAYSRTVRSLAKLLATHGPALGITIGSMKFAGPNPFGIPPEDVVQVAGRACRVQVPKRRTESFRDADIVYITRPQVERYAGMAAHVVPFTQAMADTMPAHGMILHPLPRNSELPEDVDANPRAHYFTQSDNGMRVRMALIQHLVNNGLARP